MIKVGAEAAGEELGTTKLGTSSYVVVVVAAITSFCHNQVLRDVFSNALSRRS